MRFNMPKSMSGIAGVGVGVVVAAGAAFLSWAISSGMRGMSPTGPVGPWLSGSEGEKGICAFK